MELLNFSLTPIMVGWAPTTEMPDGEGGVMIKNFFLTMGVAIAVIGLGGCVSSDSSGSGGGGGGSRVDLVGYATNGPLLSAQVVAYDIEGEEVFRNVTDPTGRFYLSLPGHGVYFIRANDALYRDASGTQGDYLGELTGWCDTRDETDCYITPASTGAARLMDEDGFNLGDVHALITQRFGVSVDPFSDDAVAGFDLAAARMAIDGGRNLSTWVDQFVSYAREHSSTPPAGYSSGGSSSPDPTYGLRSMATPEHHRESYDPDVTCQSWEVIGAPVWFSACSYSSGGSGFYVYENRGPVAAKICFEVQYNDGSAPFTGCNFSVDAGEYSSGACFKCGTDNGGASAIVLTEYDPD